MSLEQQLKDRLAQLSPTHLDVVNESSGHGGYFPGKESHFKTVIVSQAFAGLIHALAIHAFLPEEWAGQDTTSPACAHAPKN